MDQTYILIIITISVYIIRSITLTYFFVCMMKYSYLFWGTCIVSAQSLIVLYSLFFKYAWFFFSFLSFSFSSKINNVNVSIMAFILFYYLFYIHIHTPYFTFLNSIFIDVINSVEQVYVNLFNVLAWVNTHVFVFFFLPFFYSFS